MRFLAGLGIRAKRSDPVVISVAEIRSEIFAASQGVWRTRSTGRLLSRIFHEAILEIFRPSPQCWTRVLSATDFADAGPLERYVYEYFVSYRLMSYQGARKESTDDVLEFWTAIKCWCEWFRGIVQTGLAEGHLKYDEETAKWSGTNGMVEPDRHLMYRFEDPAWKAPVIVQGRARAGLVTNDDKLVEVDLEVGDCVFFPTGWTHWLHNTGDVPVVTYFNYGHEQPVTEEVDTDKAKHR